MRRKLLRQITYHCPKCGRANSLRPKELKEPGLRKCSNPRCDHRFEPSRMAEDLHVLDHAWEGFDRAPAPRTMSVTRQHQKDESEK